MPVDETQETPNILSAPGGSTPPGWLSLFRDGYGLISLMIAGNVAIHALCMRVASMALAVVTEISGLRF
jgi:hypothetical protein